MKLSYKQRIFFYFFILFTFFTVCIIILQRHNEKKEKIKALEYALEEYTDLTYKYIQLNKLETDSFHHLREFDIFLLDNVRITMISETGSVLYDKDIPDLTQSENHLNRPEIQSALSHSYGIHIRRSASTNHEYIYYAKHFPSYFIRVALPYNIESKSLLESNRYFISIILLLFVVVLLIINYVAGRFEKSILQLKNFTTGIKENKIISTDITFPDDEVGEIGKEIMEIFRQKEESNRQIKVEREKLLLHFQYSEKGICIFTHDFKEIYANAHFMYYLNLVLNNESSIDINTIFEYDAFLPVKGFISDPGRLQNQFEYKITQNEKTFAIQTVLFDDKSFEITIRNITEMEQTRLLKQQMTSNIAHELKTPVTSIHAYLESLQESKFPEAVQKQFIERAFLQSMRLVELIDDVSLISKIEEAPSLFGMEEIDILQLINDVGFDMADRLKKNQTSISIQVEPGTIVKGNHSLLYSIIRNLTDNTIKYAGSHTEIHINHYLEDEEYHYFSYYDTGKGIQKEHLNRIFERFYRIDSGRTRDAGGSGLGLSIVRNAVLFHKGKIEAKIHTDGGLQFLFTIKK
jgi:two-component system OmpR family sensor kinase/two-component system phosphate regulon sensor histidine kinase PhoR